MSKLQKIITQIKKEYWENKTSFLKAPLVLSLIILFIAFCSFSLFLYHSGQISDRAHQGNFSDLSKFTDSFVSDVFYVIASPLMIILWLVLFNYFLGCLHNDRKDRSLLFWLSMPITHTESIIAKVITGLIIAPLFTWVCIIITEFICLILLTLVALVLNIGMIGNLWPIGSILLTWGKMLIAFYWQGLWLFPLFAWCILCSAYAKKSPFLTAILPIILIEIVERLFFHINYISKAIALCFSHAFSIWINLFETIDYRDQAIQKYSVFTDNYHVNLQIDIVFGILIGLVFIVIAGFLRFRSFRFD